MTRLFDIEGASTLSDKVGIVLGASSDIGVAISNELLAKGAKLLCSFCRNEGALEHLERQYGQSKFSSMAIDFTAPDAEQLVGDLVKRGVSLFNHIDFAINAAGDWLVSPFLYEDRQDVERLWLINYWAPYFLMKAVVPHMLERGGCIVNIASTAGVRGVGQAASYAASKAALINLTESLAEELSVKGVRVNAISPGYTETKSLDKYFDESMKQLLAKHIPVGRLCQPRDVALVTICVLVSDYLTGSNITLHGGKL